MCRWAAYIGEPIFLERIVSAPKQSLMRQSLHALESKTETNGDGFGLAWYGDRDVPGVYRDVLPAWADPNLQSLAHQVQSGCFLAHVRASTGTATSRTNCHPFSVGRWSFMHNGQVGGYGGMRRKVDMLIDEELYPHRAGTTDSEAMFLLALGAGLETDPKGALEASIGHMESLSRHTGETPHMRMTIAVSDGQTLYAARYASDERAPSLYVGSAAEGRGKAVVSEPLETEGSDWEEVEAGCFVTVTRDRIDVKEFHPNI
ncbi:MAG: class II glutamine amidotransferase [Pseudomonadota bacterium]